MIKRIACFLLAVCLCAALLTGCGSTEPAAAAGESVEAVSAQTEEAAPVAAEEPAPAENAESEPSAAEEEASAAEEPAAPEEPEMEFETILPAPDGTELSMWFIAEADGVLEDFNDNAVAKLVEEETNIHVNYNMISMFAGETQFNLMVASGDFPDIVDNFCQMYTAGGDTAIDQGLIIDMEPYMQYAPNYYKIINENEETMLTARTDSGAIAAFFTVGADAMLGPRGGSFIRKDWLDDLGLEVPVTYEDYEDVLLKFRDAYNCSAAYELGSKGFPGNSCMVAGFETGESFLNKDGTVVYGPLEDGFEEYLTLMHHWYEEGLISRDFINNTSGMWYDATNVVTDQTGIWNTFYRADDSWVNNAQDPDFTPLAIADAVKEPGQILKTGGTSGAMGRYGMSVTTDCEDPAMAVAWIDSFYSEDAAVRNSYGIEHETFEFNEDGQPIYTDLILNNPDGDARSMRFKYTIMFSARMIRVVSTPEDKKYDVEDRGTWQSNRTCEWDIPTTLEMSAEDGEEYARIMSDVKTYVEECIPAFISGTMDLSEFDTFRENVRGMDIEDAVAIYQDSLDRYNLRGQPQDGEE